MNVAQGEGQRGGATDGVSVGRAVRDHWTGREGPAKVIELVIGDVEVVQIGEGGEGGWEVAREVVRVDIEGSEEGEATELRGDRPVELTDGEGEGSHLSEIGELDGDRARGRDLVLQMLEVGEAREVSRDGPGEPALEGSEGDVVGQRWNVGEGAIAVDVRVRVQNVEGDDLWGGGEEIPRKRGVERVVVAPDAKGDGPVGRVPRQRAGEGVVLEGEVAQDLGAIGEVVGGDRAVEKATAQGDVLEVRRCEDRDVSGDVAVLAVEEGEVG